MVEEGAAAPDFELVSETRETVRLSDLRGKIAPDGSVAKAMYGVKPEGHPEQVLEALPPA